MDSYDFRNLITNNDQKAICIWWFNVDQDKLWRGDISSFLPQVTSNEQRMIYGMEQMLLLAANPTDYVILRSAPDKVVLENIKLLRKKIPIMLVLDELESVMSISEMIASNNDVLKFIKQLTYKNNVYLVPFAVFEIEEKIATITRARLIGPKYSLACWINNKVNARHISEILKLNTTKGYECCSYDEIKKSIEMLQQSENEIDFVLKDAYGSSGKGLFRIKGDSDIFLVEHQAKKKEMRNEKIQVLIEKWYKEKKDINYQFFITDQEIVKINLSYQKIDNGVYIGTQFIDSTDEFNLLVNESIIKIGSFLQKKGYRGICSIDSIYLANRTFIPIIEINGRFSLSSYISFLDNINERRVSAYYFDVSKEVTAERIDEYLKKESLYYDRKKRLGIILYSFSYGETKNRAFLMKISDFSEKENAELIMKTMISSMDKIENQKSQDYLKNAEI